VWLRWKLFLRSTSVGNRVAGAAFTVLLLVAFSPAWFGGAVAAWAGVRHSGSAILPVAFGLCQLAWVSMGLLSGALGRSFDLDKFLRYPVRPRSIFAINVFASLLGPVPLMTLPTLAAVTIAASQRSGAAAALGVGAAAVCLLLVTAAVLQVLLAVLDEVLRRESTRFVATVLMTLCFVGMQFGTRLAARVLTEGAMLRFAHHEISGSQAVAIAGSFLGRIPTVAAPAQAAAGALDGEPLRLALGLLASVAILALAVLPGAALMRHTVRGGGDTGAAPERARKREAAGGAFALGGFLPRGAGAVLHYELLLTLRHPQRLMSLLMAPLIGVVFFFNGRGGGTFAAGGHARMDVGAGFVLLMLAMSVSSASLVLFSYDGPGVRAFFLLPVRPREVLLGKNLEQMLRLLAQFVLAFTALSFLSRGIWSPLLFTALLADLALIFCTLAVGTAVSMRHPVRARRRGLTGRGGNSWEAAMVSFGVFLVAGVIGVTLWGVRTLAGPVWADPAGLVAASLALGVGASIWWRSLDVNARVFLECREKMIDALARSSDD
jgi:ABC-2 type transport system permease protein